MLHSAAMAAQPQPQHADVADVADVEPESLRDLARVTQALSVARLQQSKCEKAMHQMWKDLIAADSAKVTKAAEDLQNAKFEDYDPKIAAKKEENNATRSKIEALREEKRRIVAETTEERLEPPCFRRVLQDIDGGVDSGYLSARKGTLLVANHREEDHFYGFKLADPVDCGWWLASLTEPFSTKGAKDSDRASS